MFVTITFAALMIVITMIMIVISRIRSNSSSCSIVTNYYFPRVALCRSKDTILLLAVIETHHQW